jgi:periplasmic divalent cation tolerance protein
MTPYIQVVTTMTDQTSAEQLAAILLEQRLAACVQITPCTSFYRWQGKMEQSDEMVCTIKSRRDLFPDLCRLIQTHHPYQVPEILASPVVAGAASYLDWMEQELAPSKEAKF